MLYASTVVEGGRAQFVFAGRYASMMIDVDGELWAWGCNEDGILGIGSGVAKQPIPVKVDTGGKLIRHAAGGWKHFLAVTEDGDLLSWGNNEYGQLGDGTQQKRRTPSITPLPGMGYTKAPVPFIQVIRTGVTMISAGTSHNLALTRTGTVGNGSLDFQTTPTAVAREQVVIAAGGSASFCANDAYAMKVWGHGVLPADEQSFHCPARYSVAEPTDLFVADGAVVMNSSYLSPVVFLCDVSAFSIAAGDDHAVIVGALGQVSCFGANMCGQVGNNSTVDLGRAMQILPAGTVEILSLEDRLAAAQISPPQEYMLENQELLGSRWGPVGMGQAMAGTVCLTLGPPAVPPPRKLGDGGGVPIIMRQAAGVPVSQDLVSHGPKAAQE
eukprot:Skav208072  [mRNA]  locus=scaffold2107:44913:50863:- [translate_table: standard]